MGFVDRPSGPCGGHRSRLATPLLQGRLAFLQMSKCACEALSLLLTYCRASGSSQRRGGEQEQDDDDHDDGNCGAILATHVAVGGCCSSCKRCRDVAVRAPEWPLRSTGLGEAIVLRSAAYAEPLQPPWRTPNIPAAPASANRTRPPPPRDMADRSRERDRARQAASHPADPPDPPCGGCLTRVERSPRTPTTPAPFSPNGTHPQTSPDTAMLLAAIAGVQSSLGSRFDTLEVHVMDHSTAIVEAVTAASALQRTQTAIE